MVLVLLGHVNWRYVDRPIRCVVRRLGRESSRIVLRVGLIPVVEHIAYGQALLTVIGRTANRMALVKSAYLPDRNFRTNQGESI